MDANEAKVRAAWESCAVEDHRMCCGSGSWRWVCEPYQSGWADSESAAWAAAAEFTASRQQQIAELDEEIACVKDGCDLCDGAIGPGLLANSRVGAIYQRILARLQAARAELTRGVVGA